MDLLDLLGSVRMRSDAFGSVRMVAFAPHSGEATGAENLRNVRSQAVWLFVVAALAEENQNRLRR